MKSLVFFLFTGWAVSSASAQSTSDIKMPGNIPLPTEALERQPYWVTSEKMPLVAPASSETVFGRVRFEFLKRVVVFARTPPEVKPAFCLVGQATNDRAGDWRVADLDGWIEAKYLLGSQNALYAKKRDGTDAKTHIKAMVVTPRDVIDQIKKLPPNERLKKVTKLYQSPSDKGDSLVDNPWFSYQFVYAKADNFVLLGSAPFFADDPELPNNVNKIVRGWVAEEEVEEWNTREAFSWDERTVNSSPPQRSNIGFCFKSSDHARRFNSDPEKAIRAWTADPAAELSPVSKEPRTSDAKAPPLEPWMTRFPKLQWNPSATNLDVDDQGNQLHRIGWVTTPEGNPDAAKQIQQVQAKLGELKRELGQLDVVFLIDDTASMNVYPQVKSIVEQIRKEVADEPLRTRIAISYFNDEIILNEKPTGLHRPLVSKLVDVKSKQAEEQLAELQIHQGPKNVDHASTREMLYDGIQQAVTTAGFAPDAHKLLVVIGVHGDKYGMSTDPDPERAALSYAKREERLVNRLQPDWMRPIELFAVQVCEKPNADEYDRLDFERQLLEIQTIQAAIWKDIHMREAGRKFGDFIRSADPDLVAFQVLQGFRKLKQENIRRQNEIKQLMVGVWNEMGPETQQRVNDKGLTQEGREDLLMFEAGYAWENSPGTNVSQLRNWVLMSEKDLDLLLQLLVKVLDTEIDDTDPDSIDKLVAGHIAIIAGNQPKGDPNSKGKPPESKYRNAAEAIREEWLITVRSPLLKMASGDRVELTQKDKDQLRDRYQKLRDVRDNLSARWEEVDKPLSGGKTIRVWERVREDTRDRTYVIPGSDVSWYWIDVDEELP